MGRFTLFHITGEYNVGLKERERPVYARRSSQYAAVVSGNLLALVFGTVLGWTSPITPYLLNGGAGFPITRNDISVMGSLMPIGAAFSCFPTGYLTDKLGRKTLMLSLVPFNLVGWALIIWSSNVDMICIGRFILGLCVGAICVTCPVFTTEIAQKNIRGELGSYFQLMIAIGILLTFIAGSQLSMFHLSIACAAVPIIFCATFWFFPETPVYYIMKGSTDNAIKSLKFYRGTDCDIEHEIREITESRNRKSNGDGEPGWNVFISKQGLRATFLSIVLMSFQQLCGINAAMFYSTIIFEEAGSSIDPEYATVVLGFMQIIGTLCTMFLMDRVGRIILLGASAASMAASLFIMGIYFLLKDANFDVSSFGWLPLLSLCAFTTMYAVGFGSVPWALMPEIIPSKIVGTVSSIACVINWMWAFIVTRFFSDLEASIGSGLTFWLYGTITLLATVFSFKALPETRGKSLEEIQRSLCK